MTTLDPELQAEIAADAAEFYATATPEEVAAVHARELHREGRIRHSAMYRRELRGWTPEMLANSVKGFEDTYLSREETASIVKCEIGRREI